MKTTVRGKVTLILFTIILIASGFGMVALMQAGAGMVLSALSVLGFSLMGILYGVFIAVSFITVHMKGKVFG